MVSKAAEPIHVQMYPQARTHDQECRGTKLLTIQPFQHLRKGSLTIRVFPYLHKVGIVARSAIFDVLV